MHSVRALSFKKLKAMRQNVMHPRPCGASLGDSRGCDSQGSWGPITLWKSNVLGRPGLMYDYSQHHWRGLALFFERNVERGDIVLIGLDAFFQTEHVSVTT